MALNAIDQGECPYLPKRRWVSHAFISEQMPPEVYQGMIHDGWRRSGSVFYRNTCPGCSLCIPIRADVAAFRPSKSQRRILRRNLDVRISYREAAPDRDLFDLYQRYQRERHMQDNTEEETWESFVSFLGSSPVPSLVMRYHVGDELMGAGWIDLLPEGPSSVYFVFDPRFQSRSPGTYSVLQEIRLALDLNRPWLYLGFFVPSCRSMSYKARFKPYELLIDGCWTRWQ